MRVGVKGWGQGLGARAGVTARLVWLEGGREQGFATSERQRVPSCSSAHSMPLTTHIG